MPEPTHSRASEEGGKADKLPRNPSEVEEGECDTQKGSTPLPSPSPEIDPDSDSPFPFPEPEVKPGA
jgi:hypothetical protein